MLSTPRRFATAGLALALSCLPVHAEDKAQVDPIKPTTPGTTSRLNTGKETTLTGKVVDLHQFMTGERTYRSSTTDRIQPTDRTKPVDPSIKPDPTIKPDDKDKTVMKRKNEIMGLQTSSGLVLICFREAPSVFATPRTDTLPNPKPRDTDPTPGSTDIDRSADNSRWHDQQVEVSGTMYEKDGIKFLVVTKVSASSDTKTRPDTTLPRTTPPTTPRTPTNP